MLGLIQRALDEATDNRAVKLFTTSNEDLVENEATVTTTRRAKLTVGTFTSSDSKGPNAQYVSQDKLIVEAPLLIRRLTPRE